MRTVFSAYPEAFHMERLEVELNSKMPREATNFRGVTDCLGVDMTILDHASEERFWAKVDKTETCWLWTASKMKWGGYGQFGTLLLSTGKRGVWPAHRISYELVNGIVPAGMVVDHMCHVRHCVNPSHLRAVTRKQNAENLAGPYGSNTSGVHGVYYYKSRQKWRGTVTHNGVRHYIREHANLAEAEAAIVALRNELFTHNDRDRRAA